jgi:phenylalanyl-tRNA synthetase alpha chain
MFSPMIPGAPMSLPDSLQQLQRDALAELAKASDVQAVEALRISLLGRTGRLTLLLRGLGQLDAAERPAAGKLANAVRDALEEALTARRAALAEDPAGASARVAALDMSAPGRPWRVGHLHPLLTVERDLREIFHAFGFEVFEGPEIETEAMNFEALNIPPDHPSRDLWDTLYVAEPGVDPPTPAADGTILRTHTSPVQIRAMRALRPPIRVIMPGRCYRYEAIDASHASEFFQVEGLMVDQGTTLADLKGLLDQFAKALYGHDKRTRFRPGYYPFTEPSVAFDVECLVCGGSGCPACSRTGWMTILGAGMVHPLVLRNGGIDPETHQGFAFGMGTDRITMLRYAIRDIRSFTTNDLRFLERF